MRADNTDEEFCELLGAEQDLLIALMNVGCGTADVSLKSGLSITQDYYGTQKGCRSSSTRLDERSR